MYVARRSVGTAVAIEACNALTENRDNGERVLPLETVICNFAVFFFSEVNAMVRLYLFEIKEPISHHFSVDFDTSVNPNIPNIAFKKNHFSLYTETKSENCEK